MNSQADQNVSSEQAAQVGSRSMADISESEVNGWRVLALPSRTTETAALAAFFPSGSAFDPAGRAGASSLTLSLLQKGTKNKSAIQFAEAVEDLGSHLGGSATRDFCKWSMAASTVAFEQTLDLWAEALNESVFAPEEVEKERDLQLASLRMAEDNAFSRVYRRFSSELYRGTPYEQLAEGTTETVQGLQREHLLDCWRAMVETGGGLIVAAGNFDEDALLRRLETLMPRSSRPAPEPLLVQPPDPPAEPIVLFKDAEQGFLCAGAPTSSYAAEDGPAIRVLAAILGEGMSSRLFIRLRDEKGLAYDTGAFASPARARGHLGLYIGTQGDRMEESRAGFQQIVAELRRDLVSNNELSRAKNYVAGHFLFDHQKNSRRAHYIGFFEMMGVGRARDREFPSLIEAVTAEQVREAADKYLSKMLMVELLPSGVVAEKSEEDDEDEEDFEE
jgi:zinc protease